MKYEELSRGLLYTHTRINSNTTKTLEVASFLYALIEILDEKGLLSKFVESRMGLMYQDPEYDKYTFEHEADSDCLERLDICKAICCKFPFALSRQDVEEGIINWEFGRPYLIAHGDDGYCVHLDRETYKCTVREHRTVPCRGFDCKDNEKWKVWQDYEKGIINPELAEKIEKENGEIYSCSKGMG
ncbi:MAG: YkgJ family cysteine cluster protein [Deltaproteobacteria bacterium]|nr:YkgJ family cysteine cluster protein [Deltaproteobacteria bacterium]